MKVEVAVLGFPVPNKVCVCVCVCVHGRYLEGLTVGGERERERERESQVCVYSHVARCKGVASL